MNEQLQNAAREATDTAKAEAWQKFTDAVEYWALEAVRSNPAEMRALADAACEYAGVRVGRHVAEEREAIATMLDKRGDWESSGRADGGDGWWGPHDCADAVRARAPVGSLPFAQVLKMAERMIERASETQPCGHPSACLNRSIETGVAFCSLCRMNEMLNDAVTMEVRHREERDQARASAAMWEREARRLGLEMGAEIERLKSVYETLVEKSALNFEHNAGLAAALRGVMSAGHVACICWGDKLSTCIPPCAAAREALENLKGSGE